MRLMRGRYLIYSVLLAVALPVAAAATNLDQIHSVVVKLNRETVNADSMALVAEMVGREYNTPASEMTWAVEQKLTWGEIAVFAYIRATTGRTFAELSDADVQKNLPGFADNVGMDTGKMARSLEQFLKKAERERNSRIFEQLRYSARGSSVPDLGSGFGLFQQSLDFRNIEVPSLTKTHNVGTGTVKGQ